MPSRLPIAGGTRRYTTGGNTRPRVELSLMEVLAHLLLRRSRPRSVKGCDSRRRRGLPIRGKLACISP